MSYLAEIKKVLKLIFLGNWKYLPTTLFFWNFVLYIIISVVYERSSNYSTFLEVLPGLLFLPNYLFFFILIQIPIIKNVFNNLELIESSCSGGWIPFCPDYPNFIGSVMVSLILILIIFILNHLFIIIYQLLLLKFNIIDKKNK